MSFYLKLRIGKFYLVRFKQINTEGLYRILTIKLANQETDRPELKKEFKGALHKLQKNIMVLYLKKSLCLSL